MTTSTFPALPHDIKVGDEVSYGFNGDWYHDGKVVRFSKSGKFLFTESNKYVKHLYQSRRDVDGVWKDVIVEGFKMVGGTWSLCAGIHNRQNPHF